jgi:hypothetical protein
MLKNKIVVHFADGTLLKGETSDFRPKKAEFHIETLEHETPLINIAELKAVFFVKDHQGDKNRRRSYDDVIPGGGRKMKVTFADGEELTGYASSYEPERPGFFLVPADLKSNNERIFIVAASCKRVEFL